MIEKIIDRRSFLQAAVKLTAVSMAAFNFGCSIRPTIEDGSKKIALLYGTRYGATGDTAGWVAKGIGSDVDLLDVETVDISTVVEKYDKFIIGSGIWIDGPHKKLIELLRTKKEQIEPKIIAAFIVCGTTGENEAGRGRIEGYFERFYQPLDKKPSMQAHFGGRMIIEKLSEKDRKLLSNFYRNILKREFVSWDRTRPDEAGKFGAKIDYRMS